MELTAKQVSVAYDGKMVLRQLSHTFTTGSITMILGPNGSGKSTFLKALSRNLPLASGEVSLGGQDIARLTGKMVAQRLAYMAQNPASPPDVTVRELVEYGRYPHRSPWRGLTERDREVVDAALGQTETAAMADRLVGTLSGGERQRVWLAMALAQEPDILLLDEPTTFLDISHQFELLEHLQRLNREQGLTVIMVLHDINQASRYGDELLVLQQGELVISGSPQQVVTPQLLARVFGVRARIWEDEATGKPVCWMEGLTEHDQN